MFAILERLKYNLSHISVHSWHYRVTKSAWGRRKTQGSACTYYWIKLPLALLGLLLVACFGVVAFLVRIVVIVLAWFFGFHFMEKFFTLDEDAFNRDYYDDYKERDDGTRKRFAPWEITLFLGAIALTLYFARYNQALGKIILFYGIIAIAAVFAIAGFVYFITRSWKNPTIVRARTNVSNAWHKACPPLVVQEEVQEEEY